MNTKTQSGHRCFSAVLVLCCIVSIAASVFAQPNFDMVGFATQNGGTTGGKGGETVTVKSYSDLKKYAESSSKYIIMVEGTMSGGGISVKSDKSIIGVGEGASLKGIGFSISSQNIIIRNLKMTLIGNNSVNGGDVISLHGSAKNVWIDHCEMFSEDPDVQKDIDKYDGLIDVKGKSGFITFSWNYFHNHHKCGIVGASESDLYEDRKITFHHNYYEKVKYRIPMYRGSTGHFFNNYIVGAQDASEIRNGACVRVEKNYYEKLHYSIYTPNDYKGSVERIDNIEVERNTRAYPASCKANIPYDYSKVLTENTLDVKTIVPKYAGVGKLNSTGSVAKPSVSSVTTRGTIEAFDMLGKPIPGGATFSSETSPSVHIIVERSSSGAILNRTTRLMYKRY